jgi:hypothetical protein
MLLVIYSLAGTVIFLYGEQDIRRSIKRQMNVDPLIAFFQKDKDKIPDCQNSG